jgi:hypothetical protein
MIWDLRFKDLFVVFGFCHLDFLSSSSDILEDTVELI